MRRYGSRAKTSLGARKTDLTAPQSSIEMWQLAEVFVCICDELSPGQVIGYLSQAAVRQIV
jgi:hypothetical protein